MWFFGKRYFRFTSHNPNGRGGIYSTQPARSRKAFLKCPLITTRIQSGIPFTVEEITKKEYNNLILSCSAPSGKVIDLDDPDEYSRNVLDFHNYDLMEILDKGFTITGKNIDNLINKMT